MTLTTFHQPVFVNKATGQHLLVSGPGMIHTSRETANYEYLTRKIRQHSGVKRIKAWSTDGDADSSLVVFIYPIHTEIFAPKINEINFIPGRTVFVTSEKYRPTNQRPRTALCH